ncbi:MAG: sigma-70 family RNA polymerase sigma factor [Phycisphaeraceae bacterium]|nr:sigma-70 family RNA polymerase sigma factor [Phycisphaerales bacterium]MCB9860362.1 sigma-70 family RNA polymerase sigma factor [Phycisphaeraceae bacterium]
MASDTASSETPDTSAQPTDGPSADESAFLARLRSDDPAVQSDAYEQLVRDNIDRMLVVARRILRDDAEAHDAVQDAFVSVFNAIGSFDGRSLLSTWMHRITVNAALMRLRSRKRANERSIEKLLPVFDETGHRAEHAPNLDSIAERSEIEPKLAQRVREAINELPEDHRTILILRDIEELSTKEAAAALDISPDAAKQRLHRARLALMKLIESSMEEVSGGTHA